MRGITFSQHRPSRKVESPEDIVESLKDKDSFTWLLLEESENAELVSILSDIFHFHPLAIEDCLNDGYQTPKVDDYTQYLFIICHAITTSGDLRQLDTVELDIFLGDNYLVTSCKKANLPAIQRIWGRCEKYELSQQQGADSLCHAVMDAVVDDYIPLLDQMDDEIEWLEDSVINKPNPATLERILTLKHSIMALRRIISPLREVVNRLSRDEYPQIRQHTRIYFRDVYDHLVRIIDLSESLRDIVSGALDIYLSSTSLRLNEVMRTLTVVSTIFLPLTFIAGIYGMNFVHMPELEWPFGYPMVWLVCCAIAFGMLYFFRRKGWF